MITIIVLHFKLDGISIIFTLACLAEATIGGFLFYDYEQKALTICGMNELNKKEKMKWENLLGTLPFFVVEYDVKEQLVVAEN
mmetsp:Transcript_10183/g.10164  ORF Transcript_10183/g.10164 Transcript_10183/m.10164 type:complete len:83 (+) Transcript_10183:448-696(+)